VSGKFRKNAKRRAPIASEPSGPCIVSITGTTFSNLGFEVGAPRRAAPHLHIDRWANPIEFARALGFIPHARQAEVIQSTAKRGILNCTRQWGKSTVAAVKALYTAMETPEALVLVASPSERQSAEFLQKASTLLRNLDIRPRGDGKNSCSLLLPNGSRIVGLPGTDGTVRGFSSVALLVIDEASRVSEEAYRALRPMLAVKEGALWMMSTPAGKRGFFHEIWTAGGPGWLRVSVPATECARIGAAFLEEERRSLGPWFRQEYLCEFMGNDDSLFDADLLRSAVRSDIPKLEI
jgi:hypothetical protein